MPCPSDNGSVQSHPGYPYRLNQCNDQIPQCNLLAEEITSLADEIAKSRFFIPALFCCHLGEEGGAIGLVLDLKVDHNSVLSNLPIEGIATSLEGVKEGDLALQLGDLLQHNRTETVIAKSTRCYRNLTLVTCRERISSCFQEELGPNSQYIREGPFWIPFPCEVSQRCRYD